MMIKVDSYSPVASGNTGKRVGSSRVEASKSNHDLQAMLRKQLGSDQSRASQKIPLLMSPRRSSFDKEELDSNGSSLQVS